MRRWHIIIELVLIYIVPVLWFAFGFAPDEIHVIVFEGFVMLVAFLAWRHGLSPRLLGFRRDTFIPALRLLFPGTIAGLVILLTLYRLGFNQYFFESWWRNAYFLYYILIGAVSQEFAFRGYLFVRLRQLFQPRNPSSPPLTRSSKGEETKTNIPLLSQGGARGGYQSEGLGVVAILTNGLLFSLLHILHLDLPLALGTFVFGCFLTWAMMRRQNLWAATIVHIIVGGSAIILGFV